jgi:very-short-patch-repair endonuclease
MSTKLFGFELLTQQAIDYVAAEIADQRTSAPGDSEIEKLLYLALSTSISLGLSEMNGLFVPQDENHEARLLEQLNFSSLIIRPQAVIGRRRVDFLIHGPDFSDNAKGKWRRLIVECDGHEFHERTKEQAAKDRAKDRLAVMSGMDCFRFTGSEIWRDPMGCAEQILDWAAKDWGGR